MTTNRITAVRSADITGVLLRLIHITGQMHGHIIQLITGMNV